MNRKAQGALEFLMTYGWAFLVILIMIGALAYFGVLSPTRFLPERCTISSGLACEDYTLTETDVTLLIRNNMGSTVHITDFDVTDPSGGFTCTPSDDMGEVADGATITLQATACSGAGIAAGTKFKVLPTLSYYDPRSGAGFTHDVTGELFAEVQ